MRWRWLLRIGRYLYRDFHQRVQQAMAQLDQVWSLRKGDRILLAWGNHPAFCEVLFAALGLGIEVVPFSTKLKQAESEELVGHIAPGPCCSMRPCRTG